MALHSKRKPNKIWVDKGSEFYNNSSKKQLKDNDIEMHSTHKEGKQIYQSLKNKIYKHMTLILKNAYIDKLDDIANEYKDSYHRTIKMKPVDVSSGNYVEYNINYNDKDPKFRSW